MGAAFGLSRVGRAAGHIWALLLRTDLFSRLRSGSAGSASGRIRIRIRGVGAWVCVQTVVLACNRRSGVILLGSQFSHLAGTGREGIRDPSVLGGFAELGSPNLIM